jgi:hypothetical protein
VSGVLEEAFKLSARFGAQPGDDAPAIVLAHPLDDVGAFVGGDAVKNLRCARGLQLFENRCATAHRRLIEELNRTRYREHRHDGCCLDERQLVDEINNLGRGQICDLLADADETLIESQVDALE